MRKLVLILATSAIFGLATPAFAVDAGTAIPTAQANANSTVKAKANNAMAKDVHHRRGVHKGFRHDRRHHRGFKHSRHHGYGKHHHHRPMHAR